MGNDLRQRLEALSAEACAGPWEYRPYKHDDWGMIRGSLEAYQGLATSHEGIGPPVAKSNASWSELDKFNVHRENDTDPMQPNGHFIVSLVNAFRSGDLVTLSEMEEAVAKAVAEEREACAALCDSAAESRLRQIKESDSSYIQNERWRCGKQQSQILADAIRARSEQKEGE